MTLEATAEAVLVLVLVPILSRVCCPGFALLVADLFFIRDLVVEFCAMIRSSFEMGAGLLRLGL